MEHIQKDPYKRQNVKKEPVKEFANLSVDKK